LPASIQVGGQAVDLRSLTLDGAITLAIQLNPQVQKARDQVREAEAGVAAARAGLGPSVNLKVDYTGVGEVTPPAEQWTSAGTASAILPLYTGGRVEGSVRAAQAGLVAAREGLRQAEQTITFQTRQGYFTVLTALNAVNVATDALGAAKEHERVASVRFTAGSAPRYDILRAQTEVAQQEQGLITAQNQVGLTVAALSAVIGVTLPDLASLPTRLLSPDATAWERTIPPLDELIGIARANRPDVKLSLALQDASRAGVTIAASAQRPSVSLMGGYQQVLDGGSVYFYSTWTAAAVVQMNIFDSGATRASVRQAEARVAQSRDDHGSLLQRADLETRQAYLSTISARARIEAAAKGLAQAQEARRIAQVAYENGVITSVETLDAQAALTAARTAYNLAVFDYNVSLAQLEFAIGATLPTPAAQN
jgi:outer membrane protein TolC